MLCNRKIYTRPTRISTGNLLVLRQKRILYVGNRKAPRYRRYKLRITKLKELLLLGVCRTLLFHVERPSGSEFTIFSESPSLCTYFCRINAVQNLPSRRIQFMLIPFASSWYGCGESERGRSGRVDCIFSSIFM
jgi:hypothetical protein